VAEKKTVTKKSTVESVKSSLAFFYILLLLFALRWTFVEPYVVPTGSMEPTLKTGDRLYALKCAYDVRFPFTDKILFRTGEVKRGDIILFQAPPHPEITYVKRAVGLPGDKIEFRNGALFVNGEEQKREFYADRTIMNDIDNQERKQIFVENLTGRKHFMILDTMYAPYGHQVRGQIFDGEVTVPPNHFFAAGDNRDGSSDSRFWGFVPIENLKGKAMFIWYSSWDNNPDIVESMKSTYNSLPMRIFSFFKEFFLFFPHLATGEAYVRFDRIGTLVH
jgi:signal peptidase I